VAAAGVSGADPAVVAGTVSATSLVYNTTQVAPAVGIFVRDCAPAASVQL